LSGPIKSYDSPEDILEDANYWENIPLNEQVVLEMNQPGLNYLVAVVQFANGTSGIYPAVMDVDASGSKSQGEDNLEFRMDEGEELNILDKSDIGNIQEDPGFQQAASNIICSELNNYGFQVCQQQGIAASNTIEQPSPTRSADIASLFEEEEEDEEEDNGNEDDDDGENDDDDNQ
jgi:hypothetical protein